MEVVSRILRSLACLTLCVDALAGSGPTRVSLEVASGEGNVAPLAPALAPPETGGALEFPVLPDAAAPVPPAFGSPSVGSPAPAVPVVAPPLNAPAAGRAVATPEAVHAVSTDRVQPKETESPGAAGAAPAIEETLLQGLERTQREFGEAQERGGVGGLPVANAAFDGSPKARADPPDEEPAELYERRVNGAKMAETIRGYLELRGVPGGRLPRIDLVPADGPSPFEYDYLDNVIRLGVDRHGRTILGRSWHETQHALDWLTGRVTVEQAREAFLAAVSLERALKKLEELPEGSDPEQALAEVRAADLRYHGTMAERSAFLQQFAAEFDSLHDRLSRLVPWLKRRYGAGEGRWPAVVRRVLGRARRSLEGYQERLRYLEELQDSRQPPARREQAGEELEAPALRHVPGSLTDELLPKRAALLRVGFNPVSAPGTVLNTPDRDDDSTVRRIRERKKVAKVFHAGWGLRDIFPWWSPAVRALRNEMFTRQFLRLLLPEQAYAVGLGFIEGRIRPRGVLVMDDVEGEVDAAKLNALPIKKRIYYALAMLVTGGEDTNSNNALFVRGKDAFEEGSPVILDFARALTRSRPDESGFVGVTPWVDTNHFNVLDSDSRRIIREFRARLHEPRNLHQLKHILRGLGIRGRRRKETMKLLLENADNVEAVLESHMRGANRVFLAKVADSGLDTRLAGVVSEINRSVLLSPHGGRYRDAVRFLLDIHGYGREAWIKVPSSHRYVLHPYELALLVRHLRGAPIPESDVREALAYARAGRWPGGAVSEQDLREDFEQLNRWLTQRELLRRAG